MVPLLPTLLKFISIETLPGSARIEATRGSNCLLEVCNPKDKESLVQKDDTRALIEGTVVLIQNAGDFELQVTILECLFRLTTANERKLLSSQWFQNSPAILTTFNGIREGLFEVDCRKFLNVFNASCQNRQVYSIPCKKAFLGSFELHRPHDEGLDQFWVDFNVATSNLSLYVDDMDQRHAGGIGSQDGGEVGDDGMWESIIIKKDIIKDWTVSTKKGDYCLSISLAIPSHSLLPTAPSSTSNMVFITFGMESNPSQPLHLVFGSTNQDQLQRPGSEVVSSQISTTSQRPHGKQSTAILPIHLNGTVKPKLLQEADDISPIEVLPNSQAIGERMNSQECATTPPNKSILPTPATSTPKLRTRTLTSVPGPHSSSGSKRVPLKFVSSGERRPTPKVSQSVSSIALGKNGRIVQGNTPVRKPSPSAVRNIQAAILSSALNGNETRSKHTSSLARSSSMCPMQSTGTADMTKNTSFGLSTGKRNIIDGSVSMDKGSSNIRQATKSATTKAKKGKAEPTTQPPTSPLPPPSFPPPRPPPQLKTSARPSNMKTRLTSANKPKEHTGPLLTAPVNVPLSPKIADICFQPSVEDKKQKTSVKVPSHKPKTRLTSANQLKAHTRPLLTSSVNVPSSPKTADICSRPSAEDRTQKTSARAPSNMKTRLTTTYQPKTQTGPLLTSPVTVPSSPKAADICFQSSQPPPASSCVPRTSEDHFETLTVPLKSSPSVAKKQLDSSFYSSVSLGSVKSRTVLSDIANTFLNRGGQQRLFNLSAMPKVRKRRRKQKHSSTCSSFNTSAASEHYLCVPDSMPLDVTERSNRSTRSAVSKRKYKRACLSRDHSVEGEVDQSWRGSSPKHKICKTAHIGQASKAGSRTMLASARTKRGPNGKSKLYVASFDITDSDYENVDSVQPTKPKSRWRGGKRKETLKKAEAGGLKDMKVFSPDNGPTNTVSGMERRMKDVYEPQISPEPPTTPPQCFPHEITKTKISRQSRPCGDPKDAHDELPSAKRSRKSISAPLQNASLKKKPQSRKGLARSSMSCGADFDQLKDNIQEEQSWSEFDCQHKELPDTNLHGTRTRTNSPLATRQLPRRRGGYSHSYYEGYVSYGYSSEEDGTGNKISKMPCGNAGSSKPLYIQAEVQNEEVEMSPLPPPSPPPPNSSLSLASSPTPTSEATKVSENIVQGFEDICHRLVAQSGRRDTVHAQKGTIARTSKSAKPNRGKTELDKVETSKIPKKSDDVGAAVTLTQLSRDIVNRHKHVPLNTLSSPVEERLQQAPVNRHTVYDTNSSRDSDISASSGVDSPIGRTGRLVTTEPSQITSSFISKADSHHLTSSAHLASEIAADICLSEDSRSEEHTLHDINTEMNTLMATLKENLSMARKMRDQKRTSTSRKVPEELKDLWLSYREERGSILREYEKQITTKMDELEQDANKSWPSEEGLNSLMQQHLKTLRNSRKLQQTQLQHLRTLQSSLCEQLRVLEASHLEQQTTCHGSLKNKMYNIHKKLMEESQKKKLVQIKRSLEAMLMYV